MIIIDGVLFSLVQEISANLRRVIDMSIDEAIVKEKEEAKRLRKIIKTGYDREISIEAIFCDDTDAIKEAYERFENCAKRHEQLAEWLERLKVYESDEFTSGLQKLSYQQGYSKAESDYFEKTQIDRESSYKIGYEVGYNRAIDDLIAKYENAKFIESEIVLSDIHQGTNSGLSMAIHFAEQLKAGGENEQN